MVLGSALALATVPLWLVAQETQKIARNGWVTAQQASSLTPYVEAFRSGLADLGYIEGRNLAFVLRYGDDHLERVPELAAELLQIPVDLIVAQGAANFLITVISSTCRSQSSTASAVIPSWRALRAASPGRMPT